MVPIQEGNDKIAVKRFLAMIERKIVSQGYKSSITGGKEMAGSL